MRPIAHTARPLDAWLADGDRALRRRNVLEHIDRTVALGIRRTPALVVDGRLVWQGPIGEVARRTGVTPDTLRYYEKIGLLPRIARDSGGRRRFEASDLSRLRSSAAPSAAIFRWTRSNSF